MAFPSKEKEVDKLDPTELLRLSEISLWLDSYDDIFSDFDSRPFSERALSVDFLNEAKRASRDKESGEIDLKLLIPKKERNKQHEQLIKKRLKHHFRKHHHILHIEKKDIIKTGLYFTLSGIVLMIGTAYLAFKYGMSGRNFLITFLTILFEPAGWFLFWEGLNTAIFEAKKETSDLKFYHKMMTANIHFVEY